MNRQLMQVCSACKLGDRESVTPAHLPHAWALYADLRVLPRARRRSSVHPLFFSFASFHILSLARPSFPFISMFPSPQFAINIVVSLWVCRKSRESMNQ